MELGEEMFVVGIYGGLASQMNQYAFMRILKKRFPDVDVKMAVAGDWRRYMEHNGYELDKVFGIERDGVDWKTLRRLANFYPGSGLKAKFFNAMFQIKDKFYGPKKSHITLPISEQPDWNVFNIIDVRRDILFWSNYAMGFFDEIKEELRKDFTFKPKLDSRNAERLAKISSSNSVSIHVRRGDYIKYKYPLLGVEYYKDAIERIRTRVSNPRFFIFSDDPMWCENTFSFLENKEIVTGNLGGRSYIDLQLMSACRHNILANSGFSLFAAWLNTNPDKVVIRPPSYETR